MSDVDGIDREIDRNRQTMRRALEEVAANKKLSQTGKDEESAQLRKAAQATHEKLIAEREATIQAEHGRLYDRAFKQGVAGTDSYRQAYSQADAAATQSPKALQRLIGQAKRTGDTFLERAAYHAAFDSGHVGLLSDAPSAVQAVLEYEIRHGLRRATGTARTRQIEQRLADSVRTPAPR